MNLSNRIRWRRGRFGQARRIFSVRVCCRSWSICRSMLVMHLRLRLQQLCLHWSIVQPCEESVEEFEQPTKDSWEVEEVILSKFACRDKFSQGLNVTDDLINQSIIRLVDWKEQPRLLSRSTNVSFLSVVDRCRWTSSVEVLVRVKRRVRRIEKKDQFTILTWRSNGPTERSSGEFALFINLSWRKSSRLASFPMRRERIVYWSTHWPIQDKWNDKDRERTLQWSFTLCQRSCERQAQVWQLVLPFVAQSW